MDIIPSTSFAGPVALPQPRVPITVRSATAADLPFVDGLQKRHTKQVGFMPRQQLAGKIDAGHVLIAEGVRGQTSEVSNTDETAPSRSSLTSDLRPLTSPLGYCIAADRYFKRDDVGIIYQVNVAPSAQRGLIGATLLRAVFERAAYGCRLFCCWCAQDIGANRFWEAMGFVPLAFRAGSEKKGRVHIFWQRRIVAGDTTTPWWFPAKTDAGAMRGDRLVLPIPPGLRWPDEMPVLLPRESAAGGPLSLVAGKRQRTKDKGPAVGSTCEPRTPTATAPARARARVQFGTPGAKAAIVPATENVAAPDEAGGAKAGRAKVKCDPKLVAVARELRDRWLERVNADPSALGSAGKYDVSKRLAAPTHQVVTAIRALPAPIAA